MKRSKDIAIDVQNMSTLVELTSVFEGIASMRISQIKNQVLQAQQFFNVLWQIYTQIRVDSNFRFGRSQSKGELVDKDLLIMITSEGGFSGDIDEKLLNYMLGNFRADSQTDIIVIGHHGAVLLANRGIKFVKYYKLPSRDRDINVAPLIEEVQKYRNTTVYYQTYLSLMSQDVKSISLQKAVQEIGEGASTKPEEIISEETYIFEPSVFDVVDHLERSMLHIALSQTILESKLAQYASRFRAMSVAHEKSLDEKHMLRQLYNRAKRGEKDERFKEIINGLRAVEAKL
jgi:ATP synthase F1 gamma subunit